MGFWHHSRSAVLTVGPHSEALQVLDHYTSSGRLVHRTSEIAQQQLQAEAKAAQAAEAAAAKVPVASS